MSDSTTPSRPLVDWGPTVSAESCTGCGTCIDFCHNEVYTWTPDHERVEVAFKTNCVAGCSHCATLCEAQAISFPTLEEIKAARREATGG